VAESIFFLCFSWGDGKTVADFDSLLLVSSVKSENCSVSCEVTMAEGRALSTIGEGRSEKEISCDSGKEHSEGWNVG
jgi:hypothetical protein